MLSEKREGFRVQIRNHKNQQYFSQKRVLKCKQGDSSEDSCPSLDLTQEMRDPKIFTSLYLKSFNKALLRKIAEYQHSANQLSEQVNDNCGPFLKVLMHHWRHSVHLHNEIVSVLINLTYLSWKIADQILNNPLCIQLVNERLKSQFEQVTTLELLVNLWGCGRSEDQALFDQITILKEIAHNQQGNDYVIILVCKCLKNLICGMKDENMNLDAKFLVMFAKDLLTSNLYNNDVAQQALQCYLLCLKCFCFEFIKQDQDLIRQVMKLPLSHQESTELVINVLECLYVNEPSEYYIYLTKDLLNLSKSLFRQNHAPSSVCMLSHLSQLFSEDDLKLQVFFDDVVIVKDIIQLMISDHYQTRDAAIEAMHKICENSNELQIQQLMEFGLYETALNLTKNNRLPGQGMLWCLKIVANLLRFFSFQFEADYPMHLQELALSQNSEISKEANEILNFFEQTGRYN